MRDDLINKIKDAYAKFWEDSDGDIDLLYGYPFVELWLRKDMDLKWLTKRDEFYLEALLGELVDATDSVVEQDW